MSRDETTCRPAVPAGRVQAPIPAGNNENNGEARQGSQEAPPANEIGSRDLTALTGRSDHPTKPRLLDLFCGAGGCTKGYQRAGFYVVGVDINPQPNYCGDEFIQGDALAYVEYLMDIGALAPRKFDAIHASPPCQMYSRNLKHMSAPQPMLIEPIRELLRETGLPWVIENVEGSPLPDQSDLFGNHGVMLCGTSFGMRVYRHRWFETSFPITGPPCKHGSTWAMNPHNVAGRKRIYEEFGRQDPEILWKNEMGVGWMGRYEAREAVPPAFTAYIGQHLLAHVQQEAKAA